MPELLIELLSEEIPARMQARAAADFQKLVEDRLKDAHLGYERAHAYVTPRRLTLVVDGLAERQPDRTEERKGPKVGAPEKATEGFLRATGLTSLDQCEQRTVGKADFWFAVSEIEGQATAAVLPEMIADAIRALPWPKSMRWADGAFRYVRPLQRINVVFGGEALAGSLDLGGNLGERAFGAETEGHRFMARGPSRIENFAQYKADLFAHKVILDPAERKAKIAADLEAAAKAAGLAVRPDPGLLDEVTGLVEWPVLLVGAIDAQFMDLPPEVLTTSMREHQKYFALETADGQLAPRFAVAANRETADGGKAVVAGNERVLRARLSDAKFFWDQDRRHSLASRVPALEKVVFHARLGTLGARTMRISALAGRLARYILDCDVNKTMEAGTLAKADLTSGMVGEFPELQGVMGRYYARGEGLDEAVAEAIAEHYSPQGPGDACPKAPVSVAVALAEKIDTLVGFFAIDEKPTGSRDPFALRRAALGVIRLVLENGLRLPLRDAFLFAHEAYGGQLSGQESADETAGALLDFFADRLKVHLREQGVRHDQVAAIFQIRGTGTKSITNGDLVDIVARAHALSRFLKTSDGENLLIAFRRAANIVNAARRDGVTILTGEINKENLSEDAEIALDKAIDQYNRESNEIWLNEDYEKIMLMMSCMREAVDEFFEQVKVNSDNEVSRITRLRLLNNLVVVMEQSADFSVIEG